LDNIQSSINIGKILRIAEIYQINLSIYDPKGIINNKDNTKVIEDFSCGASKRIDVNVVHNLPDYLENYSGRIIATCLDNNAKRLHEFKFKPHDMVVLGNEYDGISNDVFAKTDEQIYIELPEANIPKPSSHNPIDPLRKIQVSNNGTPCLNVAVSAGIISYQIYCNQQKNFSDN